MSYPPPPGRPPLVHGMPPMPPGGIPPPFMMNGPPPSLMPPMMPMMPMHQAPPITGPPQIRAYPKLNPNRQHLRQLEAQGPPVTVFVGNITERAPDNMIRQILGTCGHVLSWKKVKGFGFCEFNGPDAGLRAVRILHDMMVGEKRLVAKVDAKTKIVLDEYKAEKRKKTQQKTGEGSPLQDEVEEEETLDEETLERDAQTVVRIKQLLIDYKEEMNNFEVKKEEEALEKTNKILDEADVEEEKRDLITREIGKFREIMKKQEEAREVSRRKEKEKEDGTMATDGKSRRETKRERNSKSRSPSPVSKRSESRHRDKDKGEDGGATSSNKAEQQRNSNKRRRSRSREKERSRDRENRRERDRERDRERERERDREQREREQMLLEKGPTKSAKELLRDKEMEEENKEKKKAERRARDKEAAYQERLRAWETRERRRAKEYEREREKDRVKEEERERDAKRLKEFLEDYDDERDDIRYYRGRELQKRLADRVKEAESDTRDRIKEKEELDELRDAIFATGAFDNPIAEFERVNREREDQYRPRLLIDVNLEQGKQRERERERERDRERARERERERERDRERDRVRVKQERELYVVQQAAQELAAVEAEPIDSDSDDQISAVQNSAVLLREFKNSVVDVDVVLNHGRHHAHYHRSHRHHYHQQQQVVIIGAHTPPPLPQTNDLQQPPIDTQNHHQQHDTLILDHRDDINNTHSPPTPVSPSPTPPPHTHYSPATSNNNNIAAVNTPPRQHGHIQIKMRPLHQLALQADGVMGNKRRGGGVREAFPLTADDGDRSTADGAANTQEDGSKRRKLVPLDYDDAKTKENGAETTTDTTQTTIKSQEEKRKHIKSLIETIPTEKAALFAYQLDWSAIDGGLMEKKIRPWINKKIIEYIGEPEPTLVDFICSKVMAGSQPQVILEDVQMVLDEEAEVFVVKMWRLLIYEVEAKKLGLVK